MKTILLMGCFCASVGVYSQISFMDNLKIPLPKDPVGVIIKDLNNDNLNDVILSYYDNNYLTIYTQNANGTLSVTPQKIYTQDLSNISAFNIGDINQDGLPDLVVSTPKATGAFYMKPGGSFSDFTVFNLPFPVGITIGDLNNDLINDLLLTSYNKMYFAYQKTNLPGNFEMQSQDKPSTLGVSRIADISNDGRNDIIFASPGTAQIFTYRQKQEGGFEIPVKTYVNDWMDDIAVKDVNNDGYNDVVITKSGSDSAIKILYPSFNEYVYYSYLKIPALNNTGSIEIADFNNDGKNEIAAAHYGFNKVSVFSSKNNLFSNYQSFDCLTSSTGSGSLAVGDINNDGLQDIAVADYSTLSILYNNSEVILSTNEAESKSVVIYPNPASDYIGIVNVAANTGFFISDNTGKILQTGTVTGNQKVAIQRLTPGLYYINFLINNKTQTFKFIKK